jgi:hypothetical protein
MLVLHSFSKSLEQWPWSFAWIQAVEIMTSFGWQPPFEELQTEHWKWRSCIMVFTVEVQFRSAMKFPLDTDASGCIPSTFRIARHLLDRLEDSKSGNILLPELYADIPHKRVEQAKETAAILGPHLWDHVSRDTNLSYII